MSQRLCARASPFKHLHSGVPTHYSRHHISNLRTYATTTTDDSLLPQQHPTRQPPSTRPSTTFEDRLNSGPSFSDFVSGNAEANESAIPASAPAPVNSQTVDFGSVRTSKKQHTRLPEWLKTPIPVGDNYKRIKNDLRGLNLHTGMSSSFALIALIGVLVVYNS